MKQLDDFYFNLEEPIRGTFLALKEIILQQDKDITPEWKYKSPFFYYKGKMFCYLWIHKQYKMPYIGIIKGHQLKDSFLIEEGRKQIKIMLFDSKEDLPVKKIENILQKALELYRNDN